MNTIENEFLNEVSDTNIKTHKNTQKRINSKRKGSNSERDCSVLLCKRFPNYTFTRSVQSGAYIGKSNDVRAKSMTEEQKLVFVGDIRVPVNFNFIIEHKAYNPKEHEIFWELFNESSDLHSWFKQVTHDSKMVNKSPMLIVKYNNKKRIVYIHEKPFEPVFSHQSWNCYWLEDLLKQPDNFFFALDK